MNEATATHRCKVCRALWRLNQPDTDAPGDDNPLRQPTWSVVSPIEAMGKCCDNVAMGEQIEPLKERGRVEMLPGAERPEGALSWLGEVIGNGGVTGIIVIAIRDDATLLDPRIFGNAKRSELAYAGALLTNHAVNGEDA